MRIFPKNSHRTRLRKNAKVSGSQTPMEGRMQNESYPRRNDRRSVSRRGSQQTGRIGRAKGEQGRSFCGLMKNTRKDVAPRREIRRVNRRNVDIGKRNDDRPVPVWNSTFHPLVDRVLRKGVGSHAACIRNCSRPACAADDFSNCESRRRVHARTNNGFKIQLQGNRNPKRKITPAL